MELIKETNGWKLYKNENLNDYTVETPEGFKQYYKFFRIENFDRAVNNGWIWLDVEYFTGSIINSEIKVKKNKKQIYSNKHDLFLNSHHTTKEAVIESLKPILSKAKEKFEICKELLNKIQDENDFNVDYTMEGDTHGIYEDYLHISFNIDGVFCKFMLNN